MVNSICGVQAAGEACGLAVDGSCHALWRMACAQLVLSLIEMLVSITVSCGGKFLASGSAKIQRCQQPLDVPRAQPLYIYTSDVQAGSAACVVITISPTAKLTLFACCCDCRRLPSTWSALVGAHEMPVHLHLLLRACIREILANPGDPCDVNNNINGQAGATVRDYGTPRRPHTHTATEPVLATLGHIYPSAALDISQSCTFWASPQE